MLYGDFLELGGAGVQRVSSGEEQIKL